MPQGAVGPLQACVAAAAAWGSALPKIHAWGWTAADEAPFWREPEASRRSAGATVTSEAFRARQGQAGVDAASR